MMSLWVPHSTSNIQLNSYVPPSLNTAYNEERRRQINKHAQIKFQEENRNQCSSVSPGLNSDRKLSK